MPEYRKPRHGYAWLKTLVAFVCLIVLLFVGLRYTPNIISFVKSLSAPQTNLPSETDPSNTGNAETDPSETEPPETGSPETEPPETEPPVVEPSSLKVTKTGEDIARGSLVLVNADHEYSFPDLNDIVPIYGNKNKCYVLSSTALTLRTEALTALNAMMKDFNAATGNSYYNVNVAYRDLQTQTTIYSNYVNKYGVAAAEKNVSKPGYSDHHTGYGFDLTVYLNGAVYSFSSQKAGYDWMTGHMAEYGFVLRYPAKKAEITRVYGDDSHLRYVGIPHAAYMNAHDLCLEEYLTLLEGYGADGDHLSYVDSDGTTWEIWYVKAAAEGDTEIFIPLDAEGKEPVYTISGTNAGGFVVAMHR